MSDVQMITELSLPGVIRFDMGPLDGYVMELHPDGWHTFYQWGPMRTGEAALPEAPNWMRFDDTEVFDALTVLCNNGSHHHYHRTIDDPGRWLFDSTCWPEES
jgi:hypothetical protein